MAPCLNSCRADNSESPRGLSYVVSDSSDTPATYVARLGFDIIFSLVKGFWSRRFLSKTSLRRENPLPAYPPITVFEPRANRSVWS